MRMKERIDRQDNEDIILIGNTLEKSEGAELIRTIIENLMSMEITNSRNDAANDSNKLGRIQGYQTILNDIDGFIMRKNELQKPVNQREVPDEELASEPVVSPIRGGEI